MDIFPILAFELLQLSCLALYDLQSCLMENCLFVAASLLAQLMPRLEAGSSRGVFVLTLPALELWTTRRKRRRILDP